MRSFILRLLFLQLAAATFGCGGDIANLPTTPDPIIVTDTYTGTVTVNGAATQYAFTTATGTIVATLTSLGDNPPAKIGFSMGTLAGATCSVVLHNDAAVVTSTLTGRVGYCCAAA